ncbi:restriction endonuclease subunit S [Candidatus Sororendozoicomonas aggregata]|uniref:restriction endonuclease subunit S n=1 Tax=Candidatus Sororendozoicomonas aggregata TaxID=3073239 RepID=UPI002ED41250
MGSEWVSKPLGELIVLQRGHDLPAQNRKEGSVPIMGSSGLTGYHSVAKILGPGVVIGRSGNSMGEVSFSAKDYWPLNTCLYVTDFKGNDPLYIYYFLQTIDFDQFNSGSAQKSLNRNAVYPYEVLFTQNKFEQKLIGKVLANLDNKIQLNRQTNQTLEQMAQALFKSWFVDFDPVIDNALAAGNPIPPALATRAESRKSLHGSADNTPQLPEHIRALFPERFTHHPDRGWIPEGWEVNPIGKVIDNVGGGTPKTKEGTFWIGGTHPFCTPKDMSSLTSKTLLETERHLTEAGVAKISSGQLPQGTVLMSSRAPIGYLAITDVPVSVNQGIIAMKPNELFSSEYILSWAEASMEEVVSRANGSTFLEISKKNFREIPFLIPSADVLKQFDAIAKPYFQRITSIQKDVDQLTKLRDTLLPKLISGELRLPNTHQPEPDTKKKDSHETHGY